MVRLGGLIIMSEGPSFLLITGFMGAGKSTVGPLLAASLQRDFVDLDQAVERAVGMSIPAYILQHGEGAFREQEHHALLNILAGPGCIVATGGGTLLQGPNIALLRQNIRVVCLSCSLHTILERIDFDGSRPLLSEPEQARALWMSRQPAYESWLWQVSTDDLTPEEVVQNICEGLKLREIESRPFRSPAGGYPLVIQENSLGQVGSLLRLRGFSPGLVAVVSDPLLAELYLPQVLKSLGESGFKVLTLCFPRGEEAKSFQHLGSALAQLADAGFERGRPIIALGGGSIGDLAGLLASLWKRGTPIIQIPTTVLSMVDSSVGGKTAIDLPQGKNLVGAFKQPSLVLIDPAVLKTLAVEERRAGLAEALKHAMIGDGQLFDTLEEQGDDLEIDADFLCRALLVKMDLVNLDPYEKGPRVLLNLGHTFAHAFERLSNYSLRHGEAVGIGLLAAAHLSHKLNLCDVGLSDRVKKTLLSLKLPTTTDYDPEDVVEAMANDKKVKNGRLRFVLPTEEMTVTVVENVPKNMILEALSLLQA